MLASDLAVDADDDVDWENDSSILPSAEAMPAKPHADGESGPAR
jgi:hypothetical protein